MASYSNIYVKLDVLETIIKTIKLKNKSGVGIVIQIKDDEDRVGNNVSAHVEQDAKSREAKAPKFWIGNGKVFWTNGEPAKIPAKKPEVSQEPEAQEYDDLPF